MDRLILCLCLTVLLAGVVVVTSANAQQSPQLQLDEDGKIVVTDEGERGSEVAADGSRAQKNGASAEDVLRHRAASGDLLSGRRSGSWSSQPPMAQKRPTVAVQLPQAPVAGLAIGQRLSEERASAMSASELRAFAAERLTHLEFLRYRLVRSLEQFERIEELPGEGQLVEIDQDLAMLRAETENLDRAYSLLGALPEKRVVAQISASVARSEARFAAMAAAPLPGMFIDAAREFAQALSGVGEQKNRLASRSM